MLDQIKSFFSSRRTVGSNADIEANQSAIPDETIHEVAKRHDGFTTRDLVTILNEVQSYAVKPFDNNHPDHPIAALHRTHYDKNSLEHTISTKQPVFASIILGERWEAIRQGAGLSEAELVVAKDAHNEFVSTLEASSIGLTVHGIAIVPPEHYSGTDSSRSDSSSNDDGLDDDGDGGQPVAESPGETGNGIAATTPSEPAQAQADSDTANDQEAPSSTTPSAESAAGDGTEGTEDDTNQEESPESPPAPQTSGFHNTR